MNRPRFTISVLRGLDELCSLGSCAFESMEDHEQEDYGAKGVRDIERAMEWLTAMAAWYRSKEEQS